MEGGHAKEKKAELPIRFFFIQSICFLFYFKEPFNTTALRTPFK